MMYSPLLPLGFWPEVNMATLLALVGGEDDADIVAEWLKRARRAYGYAWRIMVDWAQFAKAIQLAAVRDVIESEDFEVGHMERRIDSGEIAI